MQTGRGGKGGGKPFGRRQGGVQSGGNKDGVKKSGGVSLKNQIRSVQRLLQKVRCMASRMRPSSRPQRKLQFESDC